MRRGRRLFRLAVAALGVVLGATACGPETTTGPSVQTGVESPVPLAPVAPSFSYYMDSGDNCNGTMGWWCHYQNDVEYELFGVFNDSFSCDPGCRTWDINGRTKYTNAYNEALTRIKDTPECGGWAKPYLTHIKSSGRMRFYTVQDGNDADLHKSRPLDGTTDYNARIDIRQQMFLSANNRELALTLVHEAWHGKYGSPDDIAAEATAQACVN